MPDLPLELWEDIVSILSSSERAGSSFTPEYAACAATCHSLAVLARPYLFKHITLKTRARAELLLNLIQNDRQISEWIKRLSIQGDRFWNSEHGCILSELQIWLSTEAGLKLMDQLSDLETLEMHYFETMKHWKKSMMPVLGKGWASIFRLSSITSLVIHNCDIPSLSNILEMLESAYPKLNTIKIDELHLEERPDSAWIMPERVHCLALRNITLKNAYHGDHDVNTLLGALQCPALNHLTMTPSKRDSYAMGSLKYAQHLLRSARELTNLTFLGCDILHPNDPPPLLSSCQTLTHITFLSLGDQIPLTWIPDILTSLPSPLLLETLEVSGYSPTIRSEIWTAMDGALADPRFKCPRNGRVLRIVHSDPQGLTIAWTFNRLNFTRTQELSWFRIEWLEDHKSMYNEQW